MTRLNTNSRYQQQAIEEQNLSQKMSQLSTSTTNDKELLMKEIKFEIEKIPDYLTKRNESFKKILYQARSTIETTTTTTAAKLYNSHQIEELRKIAILIYKIMVIQTYHLLWTTYLKSGMGQLIIPSKAKQSYSTTVSIWPKQIKALSQVTNGNKIDENEFYSKFVHDHLYELKQRLKQSQTELNLKANNFQDYTLIIQKIIETYIEQNLHCLRMNIEHQIELIYYDYHIQAMKLEYFRHNPTTYQKQLMKALCTSKYEQEITEQEYNLLEQQMVYYNLPSQSFECSSIAQAATPLLFDSIQNVNIRQQLYQQYKNVAEQSKANMFTLYQKTAEMQMNECKTKFNSDIRKMWIDRHSAVDTEKIPAHMIELIEQRYNKISERIQCIYRFKYQCFLLTCQT